MLTSFKSAIVAAIVAFSSPAAFAGPEAEALIRDTASAAFVEAVDADPILEAVDVDRVARFALGRYARTASAEAYERYEAAFRGYLAAIYESQLHRMDGASLTVTGSIDRKPGDAIVMSQVSAPNGEKLGVDWRVIERQGVWRVVDVNVFGVWLNIEQRAQFEAVLDDPRADLDTLTSRLQAQAAKAADGAQKLAALR